MKKILALALAAAMLFSLSACQWKKSNDGSDDVPPGTVVLNDFEDYKTGVEPLILLNFFGTAQLNTDPQYVKRGEGSLKIVPSGCSSEAGDYDPALKQPMNVLFSGNNNSDISQLTMISTEIYNASSENVHMVISLQFFQGYLAGEQEYELAPGWNSVVYNVEPQILDIAYDIADCKGVVYTFDRPETEADAPTLYMDDILLYKTEAAYVPIDMTLDENEICSFDKIFQEYILIANTANPDIQPTLTINSDMRYSKKGKSLKVFMPGNHGAYDNADYTYTGFSFAAAYVAQTGLGDYPDDKSFTFEVYNAGTSQQRLFIEFFTQDGSRYYKKTDIYVPAGQWSTVSIPMSELSGGASATTTKVAGEIYINWEINSLLEDRVLYFDEFVIK